MYDELFGLEALEDGLFGIKIGGGPASPTTTGSVEGLPIPCTVVTPPSCDTDVTATVCSQATVNIKPMVTAGTPVVDCIGDLVIGPCADLPGFEPLPPSGICTFTVSQVICATIPLTFSARAWAVPSGGACGPIVEGDECPPLPPPSNS